MTQGYCMKCKAMREMSQERMEVMTKGKVVGNRLLRGICPVCGTKMCKIIGKPKEV